MTLCMAVSCNMLVLQNTRIRENRRDPHCKSTRSFGRKHDSLPGERFASLTFLNPRVHSLRLFYYEEARCPRFCDRWTDVSL
jgi:hypothetical protein